MVPGNLKSVGTAVKCITNQLSKVVCGCGPIANGSTLVAVFFLFFFFRREFDDSRGLDRYQCIIYQASDMLDETQASVSVAEVLEIFPRLSSFTIVDLANAGTEMQSYTGADPGIRWGVDHIFPGSYTHFLMPHTILHSQAKPASVCLSVPRSRVSARIFFVSATLTLKSTTRFEFRHYHHNWHQQA